MSSLGVTPANLAFELSLQNFLNRSRHVVEMIVGLDGKIPGEQCSIGSENNALATEILEQIAKLEDDSVAYVSGQAAPEVSQQVEHLTRSTRGATLRALSVPRREPGPGTNSGNLSGTYRATSLSHSMSQGPPPSTPSFILNFPPDPTPAPSVRLSESPPSNVFAAAHAARTPPSGNMYAAPVSAPVSPAPARASPPPTAALVPVAPAASRWKVADMSGRAGVLLSSASNSVQPVHHPPAATASGAAVASTTEVAWASAPPPPVPPLPFHDPRSAAAHAQVDTTGVSITSPSPPTPAILSSPFSPPVLPAPPVPAEPPVVPLAPPPTHAHAVQTVPMQAVPMAPAPRPHPVESPANTPSTSPRNSTRSATPPPAHATAPNPPAAHAPAATQQPPVSAATEEQTPALPYVVADPPAPPQPAFRSHPPPVPSAPPTPPRAAPPTTPSTPPPVSGGIIYIGRATAVGRSDLPAGAAGAAGGINVTEWTRSRDGRSFGPLPPGAVVGGELIPSPNEVLAYVRAAVGSSGPGATPPVVGRVALPEELRTRAIKMLTRGVLSVVVVTTADAVDAGIAPGAALPARGSDPVKLSIRISNQKLTVDIGGDVPPSAAPPGGRVVSVPPRCILSIPTPADVYISAVRAPLTAMTAAVDMVIPMAPDGRVNDPATPLLRLGGAHLVTQGLPAQLSPQDAVVLVVIVARALVALRHPALSDAAVGPPVGASWRAAPFAEVLADPAAATDASWGACSSAARSLEKALEVPVELSTSPLDAAQQRALNAFIDTHGPAGTFAWEALLGLRPAVLAP